VIKRLVVESFWLALAGTGIVAFLFGFWVNNYFAKYVGKKAENLATHEDIRMLVDQVRETERIKAEITHGMWDRQRRWEFKRDTYIELIEILDDLHLAQLRVSSGQKSTGTKQDKDDRDEAVIQAVRRLHRKLSVGEIVMTKEATQIINDVGGQTGIDESSDRFANHKPTHDALNRLIQVARKDLGYSTDSE
jgi:hypothetical protein